MSILVTAIVGLWFNAQAAPATPEGVWFWFATCGGPAITVEVKVHGTIIQKLMVPVCRAPREAVSKQGQTAGRIDFAFRPQRPIVWEGYRDEKDRTVTGQVLEGSLWQAGAAPDAMLIGVSFMTADRIVMNTIHVAHAARRDESQIARGVTVTTYPAQ